MRKNIFDMGAKFDDEWSSDNKPSKSPQSNTEIKTPQKHQLHTAKERRRGKVVTIVGPFYLSKEDMASLLKKIKKRLGTGGTIKDNALEFQGDIASSIREHLIELEYRFKS